MCVYVYSLLFIQYTHRLVGLTNVLSVYIRNYKFDGPNRLYSFKVQVCRNFSVAHVLYLYALKYYTSLYVYLAADGTYYYINIIIICVSCTGFRYAINQQFFTETRGFHSHKIPSKTNTQFDEYDFNLSTTCLIFYGLKTHFRYIIMCNNTVGVGYI